MSWFICVGCTIWGNILYYGFLVVLVGFLFKVCYEFYLRRVAKSG